MTAYVIFTRESKIRDQAEYDTYRTLGREARGDHKLTALVQYGEHEALEGGDVDGVVVLQFPTVEEAKAWYNSPAYQKALVHRKNAADYRVLVVQGL